MRALLLPVKDLRNAKQRLAGFLTPEERFDLARAMLADTFRAVRNVRFADKILVITNYQPAAEAAAKNGWEVLSEAKQISESASVDFASQWCANNKVTAALRVPLDIPLVKASDVDDLLATDCTAPSLLIVPSRDATGTNAILRTPPALFPSRFGEGSFAKHCAEATRVRAQILIRRNARLEMDVDDESDLRALVHCDLTGTETGPWLQRSRVWPLLQEPARQKEQAANALGNFAGSL